jgi:hypothetical protein
VAIDLHPTLALEPVWPAPPPIYAAVAERPTAVLAEFPFTTDVPGIPNSIPYMYFSLWHWRPMVNGYSGFSTVAYEQLKKDVAGFPGPSAMAVLRAHGVTHVSVNCAFYLTGCEQVLEALDNLPEARVAASGRWQGKEVRLYAIE